MINQVNYIVKKIYHYFFIINVVALFTIPNLRGGDQNFISYNNIGAQSQSLNLGQQQHPAYIYQKNQSTHITPFLFSYHLSKTLFPIISSAHINNLASFRLHIKNNSGKVYSELKKYKGPLQIERLVDFITDNWYPLQYTYQIVEGFRDRYLLESTEIAFLSNPIYETLLIPYLPKKATILPTHLPQDLQQYQEELCNILTFLEQLYLTTGRRPPLDLVKALAEQRITPNLESLKKSLQTIQNTFSQKMKNYLEQAIKKSDQGLPNLLIQNYLPLMVLEYINHDIAYIYTQVIKSNKEKMKEICEQHIIPNNIALTIQNMETITLYHHHDGGFFARAEIVTCLQTYILQLQSYRGAFKESITQDLAKIYQEKPTNDIEKLLNILMADIITVNHNHTLKKSDTLEGLKDINDYLTDTTFFNQEIIDDCIGWLIFWVGQYKEKVNRKIVKNTLLSYLHETINKLAGILKDNVITEDKDDSLDNLANPTDCLPDDDENQNFLSQPNIQSCIARYQEWLTQYNQTHFYDQLATTLFNIYAGMVGIEGDHELDQLSQVVKTKINHQSIEAAITKLKNIKVDADDSHQELLRRENIKYTIQAYIEYLQKFGNNFSSAIKGNPLSIYIQEKENNPSPKENLILYLKTLLQNNTFDNSIKLINRLVANQDIQPICSYLTKLSNSHEKLSLFFQEPDIKICMQQYEAMLTSYQSLPHQIDNHLNIIVNQKLSSFPTVIGSKLLYSYLISKSILQQYHHQKLLLSSKYNTGFLPHHLQRQLRKGFAYALGIEFKFTVQELVCSQYSLRAEEKELIENYILYDTYSSMILPITSFTLPELSKKPILIKAWKAYFLATKWLNSLALAWFNVTGEYAPHAFFVLAVDHHIMQYFTHTPISSIHLQKFLHSYKHVISKIYQENATQEEQNYIAKGHQQIFFKKNFLQKPNLFQSLLLEYTSPQEYLQANRHKVIRTILSILFPETHQTVFSKIGDGNYDCFDADQLYQLRRDIQSNQSKLLPENFISNLSKREGIQFKKKEAIVKRLNIYIEAMLLVHTMISTIDQYLENGLGMLNTSEVESYTNFCKRKIEILKVVLGSIVDSVKSQKLPIDILQDPLKYEDQIITRSQIHANTLKRILSNLDLRCYQKMLAIITSAYSRQVDQNKQYFCSLANQYVHVNINEKNWWSGIRFVAVLGRTHDHTVNQTLEKVSGQLQEGSIPLRLQSVIIESSASFAIKIVDQTVKLYQKYFEISEGLSKQGIPSNQIKKICLFILSKKAKEVAKKNIPQLKKLRAEDILSWHDIKAVAHHKGSLVLALPRESWQKIGEEMSKRKFEISSLTIKAQQKDRKIN